MFLTRNNFSSNVSFVNRFVRKHWLTNDVTDSEDVINVCFKLLINIDEATLNELLTEISSALLSSDVNIKYI